LFRFLFTDKLGSAIKRIDVQATSATQYHPVTSYPSSYAYENLSIKDTAIDNDDYDDSDDEQECVLMDISDGDITSVDMPLILPLVNNHR
jgi:hypothetical protein